MFCRSTFAHCSLKSMKHSAAVLTHHPCLSQHLMTHQRPASVPPWMSCTCASAAWKLPRKLLQELHHSFSKLQVLICISYLTFVLLSRSPCMSQQADLVSASAICRLNDPFCAFILRKTQHSVCSTANLISAACCELSASDALRSPALAVPVPEFLIACRWLVRWAVQCYSAR